MEVAPRRYDRVRYERETGNAKYLMEQLLERAENVRSDPKRIERHESSVCQMCFYCGGRVGGACVTFKQCDLCGVRMMHGSTATDAVCLECAKKHGVCRRCGADVDLKMRRKPFKEGC